MTQPSAAVEWVVSKLDMATCAPLLKADAEDAARQMRAAGFTEEEITQALTEYAYGNCSDANHGHESRDEWWEPAPC